MSEGVAVGIAVSCIGFLLALMLYDVSQTRAHNDIRKQCELQGSFRLDGGSKGEALFYCYREPKK